MLTESQRDYLGKVVRVMQIIVAAMAMGVVMFLVVVLAVMKPNAANLGLITYMALAFAVVMFLGWLIVPGVVTSRARQAIAKGRMPQLSAQSGIPREAGVPGQLATVFQTRLIIGCALLEGAAFFNLMATMLEGAYVGLATAAVLLLIIISQFPTRDRLESWITHELETIEQLQV